MLKELIEKAAKEAIEHESAFLFHLPEPVVKIQCEGVEFIFKQFNIDLPFKKPDPNKDPLLPPYDDYLFVKNCPGNDLIINKYMQTIGHVLFSSTDKSASQVTHLNGDDFLCISEILKDYGYGFAYFNRGINSGCSQQHKHFQYTPYDETPVLDAMSSGFPLPFIYYYKHIDDIEPNTIQNAYQELLPKIPENQDYNFIVKRGICAIVPRRKARCLENLMLNSIAVCGIFGVKNPNDPELHKNAMKFLFTVCIPKDEDNQQSNQ